MEDISKNKTRCNLRPHGRFLQARSHMYIIICLHLALNWCTQTLDYAFYYIIYNKSFIRKFHSYIFWKCTSFMCTIPCYAQAICYNGFLSKPFPYTIFTLLWQSCILYYYTLVMVAASDSVVQNDCSGDSISSSTIVKG